MIEGPKFTRGPWRSGIAIDRSNLIPILHDDPTPGAISSPLAKVVARMSRADEAWANACLIAAAPDLYEALTEAMNYIHSVSVQSQKGFEKIDRRIHMALAKARGEKASSGESSEVAP